MTTISSDLAINPASYYFLPQLSTPPTHSSSDVCRLRRDFPALQQSVQGHPLIWLDNAATTQKPGVVVDALAQFYECDNANVYRANHTLAKRATQAYQNAREKVRCFLGANSTKEIIFLRGSTEGINLVAQSYGRKYVGQGMEIAVSVLEHHSNIVPWQVLCQEKDARLRVLPVDDRGDLLLEECERIIGPSTRLVAISHVSNAVGTLLPIQEIIRIAHRHGAHVLVDGAQAVSHFPTNVQELDTDFYVFSGHKVFGPTGIGVLYGKQALLEAMPPWQSGGQMIEQVTFEQTSFKELPFKFEAGTGSIADAIGLGAAIDYLSQVGLDRIHQYEQDLMAYAQATLQEVPGLHLVGTPRERLGAISFVLDGMTPEDVGNRLDREGIAVRAGHHCAQPALHRFGYTSTVRPSLAFYNTKAEIDQLVTILRRI